jgi:predicted acyltransferase
MPCIASLRSGGWVLLILTGFYALIDLKGWRRWEFPLIVVGMNSIAVLMSWTMSNLFSNAIDRHFGKAILATGEPSFPPALNGFAVLLVIWLILFWMCRRKIFLRI